MLVILALGAGLGWAGTIIFAPPPVVAGAATYVLATAKQGSVGSSIALTATAEWSEVPSGNNMASGIVTSVNIRPGQQVSQGTVLYEVGLRPVVIGQGAVPAFRDLAIGTAGPDVSQLQELLAAEGIYRGPINGTFSYSTSSAVRTWQTQLGEAADGRIGVGDVIWMPTLPSRINLSDKVVNRGASLGQGESVVSLLSDVPTFTIAIAPNQAIYAPQKTSVEITAPNGDTWTARAGEQSTDTQGNLFVNLVPSGDGPICQTDCALVPTTGSTTLTARIITVPTVQGVVIPSGALESGAEGKISVEMASGRRRTVSVVASASGMSVVNGLHAGSQIRVARDANK